MKTLPQKITPVMAQYHSLKETHQDCLLFFRMGEFYELFFADAVLASSILDIVLTKRGKQEGEDIPMCGVPVHTSETYWARLIRKGHKVAICEQLEDPKTRMAKGPLKRDVVRIITPGTLTEESLLEANRHNFLLSLCDWDRLRFFGLAYVDISTGDFWTENHPVSACSTVLSRLQPEEILVSEQLWTLPNLAEMWQEWKGKVTPLPSSRFDPENGKDRLQALYNITHLPSLGAFSLGEIAAAGTLIDYLSLTQKQHMPRLKRPKQVQTNQFLELDKFTRRNLELTKTLQGEREGSLLHTIDCTVTAAGSRLLFLWLNSPLRICEKIHKRLENVAFFTKNPEILDYVRALLKQCPDIERALSRLSTGRGSPRDLATLQIGLGQIPDLKQGLIKASPPKDFQKYIDNLPDHTDLVTTLTRALGDPLPLTTREGGFIKAGYCPELDALCRLRDESQAFIEALQHQYIQETGIINLKIRHHQILGYSIEISPSQAAKIPFHFHHKQTLTQVIRYTTDALMELTQKISAAAEQALALENTLFHDLVTQALSHSDTIRQTAQIFSIFDVTTSLAYLALKRNWVQPRVDDSLVLQIQKGRHGRIEQDGATPFIPNDCILEQDNRFWLMTGPNMAGKSTFLRQNALIPLLAQMGSFVPAESAHIGVVDRIFSRVGASDDLARGHSTFMVEMIETATILNQATERSLVILDEVGRGTATYDGLALAWACLEHLCKIIQCRTLFATHYHELTALEGQIPGLACYTLKVHDWDGKILFLHEVIPGKANRSYGVHVARLAGLPESVIKRAEDLLPNLEGKSSILTTVTATSSPSSQDPDHDLIASIMEIPIDDISPRKALNLLYELKNKIQKRNI